MSEEISPWGDVALPLGELLVRFNSVEAGLGSLVAALTKQDFLIGSILSAVLSFSQKLKLIEMLVDAVELPPGISAQCKEIITQAKKLNTFRNRAVHSEYHMADEDIEEGLHWWRRHRDAPVEPEGLEGVLLPVFSALKISDIERHAHAAHTLTARLEFLSADVAEALDTVKGQH